MLEKLILANPRGFCAGVEMSLRMFEDVLESGEKPYATEPPVHNDVVFRGLEEKGAVLVGSVGQVPVGSTLVISAHGVSPAYVEAARSRQLNIVNTTCPLVDKVHREAGKYATAGYSIILVGHANHVEIQGTRGIAPEVTFVVGSVEDALSVQVSNPEKVALLTQTTFSMDDAREIIGVLHGRFPHMAQPVKQDICYATQHRQDAVRRLVRESGIEGLIVVGSKSSSNGNRLKDIAQGLGIRAYLIDTYLDMTRRMLDGMKRVGMTSAASTPERLVEGAVGHISGLYPRVKVIEQQGGPMENQEFHKVRA